MLSIDDLCYYTPTANYIICTVAIELHYSMAVSCILFNYDAYLYIVQQQQSVLQKNKRAAATPAFKSNKKNRQQKPFLLSNVIINKKQQLITLTHYDTPLLGSTHWTVAHHPPTHCFTSKLLNPKLLPVNQARDRDRDVI